MDAVAKAFVAEARSHLSDDYLAKIERCIAQIDDTQVWWRPNGESNSIGNLLLHLNGNARQWIVAGIGGAPDLRVRESEFAERSQIPRMQLLETLRQTLREVDAVLASLSDEGLLERKRIQGLDVSVLHAVFHVVEHFAMHTGQIIYLTKQVTSRDLGFYGFEADVPKPNWVP